MKTIIHLIYPAVKTVTRKLAAFAALTLTCATVLGVPPGGGGGGNTGGGTIYFIGPWDAAQQGGTAVMRTMNSDGSNNRQLGFGLFGNPSMALHGGQRWFLYHQPIPDSFYPDGTQVFELFALRDDYDSNLTTTAPRRSSSRTTLTCRRSHGTRPGFPAIRQISFKARRWSGGVVVAGGIYTASPVFDANGNITGLAAQPTTPAIPFPLVETAPGDLWPAFEDYSWTPRETRWFTQASGITTYR